MLHKLKLLFLLIPIFLLTSCGEGDSIFTNLDGEGQLIYLGIILALAVIGLVFKLLFRIIKGKKQAATSSQPEHQPLRQPHVQPLQQVQAQQQIQQQQPISATMPPPPSVEMINELSKSSESQKEIA